MGAYERPGSVLMPSSRQTRSKIRAKNDNSRPNLRKTSSSTFPTFEESQPSQSEVAVPGSPPPCTTNTARGVPFESTGPKASSGSKRPADSQVPPVATKSPLHRHKPNAEKALMTIDEIKVYTIKHVSPKTGEDWYRAQFWVTFKNSTERLNVRSTRAIWQSGDHKLMRDKVQRAIHLVADKIKLDLISSDYMTSDWPWKYLWVVMLNEVTKLKLSTALYSISRAKGVLTQSENIVSNDWKRGTNFKDRGAKFRAKNHVLLELEKRTDK